jgi:hypothetical protein
MKTKKITAIRINKYPSETASEQVKKERPHRLLAHHGTAAIS